MTEKTYDYSKLDQPPVLQILFHPRREPDNTRTPANVFDSGIPVEEGVRVHARFHLAGPDEPNILFFHGNGEIVSDYDDIGPYYTKTGMNFLAVDYRGYGKSSGSPTVTAMLQDAHLIFRAVQNWLAAAEFQGPLLVMGRSLGAAAALELAHHHADEIGGLIIESGFSTTLPLLLNLGLNPADLGITEEDGFHNVRKISTFTRPTLIIHGQHDEIIPVNSAAILQAQSPARSKEFQVVPRASHNTIIADAGELYFTVIKQFCNKISGIRCQRRRKMH